MRFVVATREGGVDRNAQRLPAEQPGQKSPPARVAWIEISSTPPHCLPRAVATREGGVDRNRWIAPTSTTARRVATREGGVDRNVTPREIPYDLHGSRHPRGWRG